MSVTSLQKEKCVAVSKHLNAKYEAISVNKLLTMLICKRNGGEVERGVKRTMYKGSEGGKNGGGGQIERRKKRVRERWV